MSRRPAKLQKALSVCLMMTVTSLYCLVPSVFAQTGSRASGELTISGPVMINGTAAISGATIFSDSTIKTPNNGAATVDVARVGRIELGPDSEMLIRFSSGMLGGNLVAGRVMASTPAGVMVSIVTREGTAVVDGKQASVLTVDVTCGNTRVLSARSAASVTSGSKVQPVAAGTEVAVGQAGPVTCKRIPVAHALPGWVWFAIPAIIAIPLIIALTHDGPNAGDFTVSGFRP
jgi:hypothetical protein